VEVQISLFFKELIFFIPTQIIGIFTALKISEFLRAREEFDVQNSFSVTDLLIFLLLLSVLVILLKRFSLKSGVFFKVFLALAIFLGSQTVFSTFSSSFVSIVLAIILLFVLFKFKLVLIQNIAVLLGIAGISAVFGLSLTPLFAALLLVFLSFYDIIAVYKTKHMIKLAQNMIKSHAIFGFIMPSHYKDYFKKLEHVEPGEQFMILGSGDIAMPLILAVSVLSISFRFPFYMT